MGLIETLKERQGDRTQSEFAADLGIPQGSLSRIYSGDRRLGVEIGKKISRRYPELAHEVAAFLLSDDIPAGQDDIPAPQENGDAA